jgi:hypothetical protein
MPLRGIRSWAADLVRRRYGVWSVTAGYTYYYLGAGTVDFNTEQAGGDIRDSNHNEHVFSGNIALTF